MKQIYIFSFVLILFGISLGSAQAQSDEKNAVTTTIKQIFSSIDQGDIRQLKTLADADIRVHDSAYSLRMDGWEEFSEYILIHQDRRQTLRTFIHQMDVTMLASVAVVHFYFNRHDIKMNPNEGDELAEDRAEEEYIEEDWTHEVGRGTIVFLRRDNRWKAVSIHLSQFPTSI